MQSEFINQYHLVLDKEEIGEEFKLMSLLMQECKRAGFKNKFRDLQPYVEARYESLSEIMIQAGVIELPAKPQPLNGNFNQ